MNSFDEIQIEEDAAYFEWVWANELATREALDSLYQEDIEEANMELLACANEPTPW